ncbi:MAG TPA: tetratricopeptide repeat protein [Actinomycetota bacterium]|nr:tetratricopeptide repeat protein [Actinomycetota bacterium]
MTPPSAQEIIEGLEARLRKTPKLNRPLEHGLLRYQLALAYVESPLGIRRVNFVKALESLHEALSLFSPIEHPIEYARSRNALGVVLRELGKKEDAAEAFRDAAERLPDGTHRGERGGALNNLGLTLGELGRPQEAVTAYEEALRAFEGDAFVRQRISVLYNLGQAQGSPETGEGLQRALAIYEQALKLANPQEMPDQWALLHHARGGALTGLGRFPEAVEAFHLALGVFTRPRFPFHHALAMNNLGLAYAQLGDRSSLRRAVAAFEEALWVLDIRLHRQVYEEAYRNLHIAESALKELGEAGGRADYFARVLDESPDAERLGMLRERIEYFLRLPEPSRSEELADLDRAVLALDERGAWRVTATWLNVLMELPNEALVAGLQARLAAHEALDPQARQNADWMLDMVITQELLAPQRMRVRDTLSMLGHERPAEVPEVPVPEGTRTPAEDAPEVDEILFKSHQEFGDAQHPAVNPRR